VFFVFAPGFSLKKPRSKLKIFNKPVIFFKKSPDSRLPSFSSPPVSCGFLAGRYNLLNAATPKPTQAKLHPLGSMSKSFQRSNKLVKLNLRCFETALPFLLSSFVAMLRPACKR
jgi:hypothetical protein